MTTTLALPSSLLYDPTTKEDEKQEKRRRKCLMRSPGFPPGYIFDVVNLELASNECAPLENRTPTNSLTRKISTAIQKK
jgi:hypothetical protein